MKLYLRLFLDKEKDIIVNFYRSTYDELNYVIETPYHNSGNLISNLAKICGVSTSRNEHDMKIIKGSLPLCINGDNREVFIFRLGGIKIANIYTDGKFEIKAKIPAISKTLMSQTKNYTIPADKTIVKSYILNKSKFRTDLHTHMNANLSANCLIALGLCHQIKYPLYYIKKLKLKMSDEQICKVFAQRTKVKERFKDCSLSGKYLTRRIDDNTFINFADFIFNNMENAKENLDKIRISLSILKDGQAVFTNLEKLYLYRYVFAKGIESSEKIDISHEMINNLPDMSIKLKLTQMIKDKNPDSPFCNNSLLQDKLLWIARSYAKQGIFYTEIANSDLCKKGMPAIHFLEEVHEIMPEIEKETGVKIRFLAAIRRIPLTIINSTNDNVNYLRESLDVIKTVAKSPYVVGSDFMGEEINDISDLQPVIKELTQYVNDEDKDFVIRIHAGENDSLRDNVANSIRCIQASLQPNQKMPHFRIGHGLYTANLNSKEGKKLIETMKETGAVLEFQLTSNVRLNNLSDLKHHPLKTYLRNGIKCVQGTDGCGFYGIDTFDEQLALHNLIGLDDDDFIKMRAVEDEIINQSDEAFARKCKSFEKFLNGRNLVEALLSEEKKIMSKSMKSPIKLRLSSNLDTSMALKGKIKNVPEDKIPIVIAGGSFNAKGRHTVLNDNGKEFLRDLLQNINANKACFVVGHTVSGYEKAAMDIAQELGKDFEFTAIVPKSVSKLTQRRLQNKNLDGVCISPESEDFGIYKSFNYEIFERRSSIVIAFDGNSPVSNLVQEAKNGKGKAKIYVNEKIPTLKEKANSLDGYVVPFDLKENFVNKILEDNPELV